MSIDILIRRRIALLRQIREQEQEVSGVELLLKAACPSVTQNKFCHVEDKGLDLQHCANCIHRDQFHPAVQTV